MSRCPIGFCHAAACGKAWVECSSVGFSRCSAPYISSNPQQRRTHTCAWEPRWSALSTHSYFLACGAFLPTEGCLNVLHLGRFSWGLVGQKRRSIASVLELPFSRLGESCCRYVMLGVPLHRSKSPPKPLVCCFELKESSVCFVVGSSPLLLVHIHSLVPSKGH